MSSTLPPSEPPAERFAGATPPEILDQSSGTSIVAPDTEKRSGLRKGLLIGGGAALLVVVGGGAFAAMSFFGTGPQPAEALPAGTLGYAGIDLDPSGGQKLEALKIINKFPTFKDIGGLDAGDDLHKTIFDLIQDQAKCPGLDYEDDIKAWLGDRAAIAAVKDSSGDPQPVIVVQVKDADAADQGLTAIKGCSTSDSDQDTAWVIDGDWAIVAQTEAIATSVDTAAQKANLADDPTFQKWTGETGDSGVATLYAAPSAGPEIMKQLAGSGDIPDQFKSQLEDFKGIAATIRFSDGALEMEAAGQTNKDASKVIGTTSVGDQIGSLPDDTAAAFGVSLGKDWFQGVVDSIASSVPGGSADDFISSIEDATGLTLPDDIETLTGDGVVVSVGAGIDPETIANASDLSGIPIAIKLHGDPDKIQAVIDKLQSAVPDGDALIGTSAGKDTVILGPDADYRDDLLADGGLGKAKDFTSVVRNPESPGVFYVNVNEFEKALTSLLGSDEEFLDNIKPLSAIGFSTSQNGDITHLVLRVGTDK